MLIANCFIISFFIFAIWVTMQKNMIFEEFGDFIFTSFNDWVCKIVYDCPICMTPYYGALICLFCFFTGLGLQINSLSEIPFILLGSMGINTIIVKFLNFNTVSSEKDEEIDRLKKVNSELTDGLRRQSFMNEFPNE